MFISLTLLAVFHWSVCITIAQEYPDLHRIFGQHRGLCRKLNSIFWRIGSSLTKIKSSTYTSIKSTSSHTLHHHPQDYLRFEQRLMLKIQVGRLYISMNGFSFRISFRITGKLLNSFGNCLNRNVNERQCNTYLF